MRWPGTGDRLRRAEGDSGGRKVRQLGETGRDSESENEADSSRGLTTDCLANVWPRRGKLATGNRKWMAIVPELCETQIN